MRLIADGVVDRAGVAGLASALAVSQRQLHRLLVECVGAPPLALARSQRAYAARVLIETTALPFTEIAFAAGFTSVRQFNETMRQIFAASPSDLRAARRRGEREESGRLTLRLALRQPYDGDGVMRWFSARAVPGVEEVVGSVYRRTLRLPSGLGVVALEPRHDHVRVSFRLGGIADLAPAVHRCRRLFDLDADPYAYVGLLEADEALAPLVAANPGLRVPGAVDGAETAVRAVLGQQVSLAAARTLAARVVAACGSTLDEPDGGLTLAFPDPASIGTAALEEVGMPASRRKTVRELARRLVSGELALDGGADRAETRRRLLEIRGIGAWTATYISLRALGDPDAFPAADLGLRRAARSLGLPSSAAALAVRSERWRPWRSYAAHYLWAT